MNIDKGEESVPLMEFPIRLNSKKCILILIVTYENPTCKINVITTRFPPCYGDGIATETYILLVWVLLPTN